MVENKLGSRLGSHFSWCRRTKLLWFVDPLEVSSKSVDTGGENICSLSGEWKTPWGASLNTFGISMDFSFFIWKNCWVILICTYKHVIYYCNGGKIHAKTLDDRPPTNLNDCYEFITSKEKSQCTCLIRRPESGVLMYFQYQTMNIYELQ